MTRKKKKAPDKTAKSAKPSQTTARIKGPTKSLPTWAQVGLAALAFLCMTYFIFPENVFKNYDFKFGGDNLAAAPVARMGEDFAKSGNIPDWCPYILGGMPMVGSLMYANQFYPGFFVGKILKFLFFGSQHTWLFLHFLLAGFGIFLLLRNLKVYWIFAGLCALYFAFNPSMVVFADVGHGSKLMTIAYLPWILLFTKRLFDGPTPGHAAWLAVFYGLQLLALHVQIAYYGAMMMGLYALYSFISGGKGNLGKNVKATLLLLASGVLAFAIASPLYLQVLEYSHYSIRGGGATGGTSWDYATVWSFHPLETLTYIFPSFFGFGGGTYWGYMPFTDMPLYWGGAILLFAPWALFLKRDKTTIFLIVLAVLAWIISFGKFLPVLFWPLFELLPYFNKFRVPSLIQVLVLLPMVVLAGKSLHAIWETAQDHSEEADRISRKFLWIGGIISGLCLLLLMFQGALGQVFFGWITAARPQLQSGGAAAAFEMFNSDVIRLLLLIVVLYGVACLVLKQKWPRWLLIAAVGVSAVLELNYFDKKLIHPTPPQQMEAYLQADDVVKFLKDQDEPFRIFPLTSNRNPDWYIPHHIETILGYTAAKMRIFQEAVDSVSYNNFNFLSLLNTRYFISDKPIVHDAFEEVFVGKNERVSRYKNAFPRAFLVNRAVRVSSPSEALNLHRGGFDFSTTAAVETPLSHPLDADALGRITWIERTPDHLVLDVENTGRQLLVLSEVYYPSGWKATLDGHEVLIMKTNFLFRGLEIPAGQHRVEMSFQPKSAGVGNMLKWVALGIVAVMLAISLFRKSRSDEAADLQQSVDGI